MIYDDSVMAKWSLVI